jgi:hypothetical protein
MGLDAIDCAQWSRRYCVSRGGLLRKAGCVCHETQIEEAKRETVIVDLMTGQYSDPEKVVAFNTVEKRAHDVSADIAREIRRRSDLAHNDLSSSVEDFVLRHTAQSSVGRRDDNNLPRTV